jgi:hypothetical protein
VAGAGYDLDALGERAGFDVSVRMRSLLAGAQQAGAVRGDVSYLDVKALMTACMSRPGEAVLEVVLAGLRD